MANRFAKFVQHLLLIAGPWRDLFHGNRLIAAWLKVKSMKHPDENAGEFRSDTCKPPRSHDEALSIIRKARERLGKRDTHRTPAQQLVRENLAIITELRDRGHRQEDAVLLILEVSNDAHKPDTIRKAIRSVVGDWVVSAVDPVAASHSEVPSVHPDAVEVRDEPTTADKDEGGLVL